MISALRENAACYNHVVECTNVGHFSFIVPVPVCSELLRTRCCLILLTFAFIMSLVNVYFGSKHFDALQV